jgi:putative ABC transport system permease protein
MLWQNLKYAIRTLAKAPGFAAIAVLTLALGIGVTTSVFSVVECVLLKPLPYYDPGELVYVSHTIDNGKVEFRSSPSTYFIYREQGHTFQDIGLYEDDSVNVTGLGDPEQVPALDVTDGVLPILGVPPMLGRFFSPTDNPPGSPRTVILSYGFWSRKFGGDATAVGRTLTVDGRLRQIIGVMPQRFRFLMLPQEPQLFLPEDLNRDKTILGQFHYFSIARLKPGVTVAQASADVARMLPIVFRSFPPPPGFPLSMFLDAHFAPRLMPLKDEVVGDTGRVLWVLMAGIGIVLLIACANVANLLLVRAEGRQREFAVRAALGAAPGHIAAGLLIESLVLGLLGGAVGLGVAYLVFPALLALAPAGLPRANEIGLNAPVLLFAFAVSLLASLMSGAIPVIRHVRGDLGTGLREGGRAHGESRQRHRVRDVLVIAQVGLAFVSLVCSGLMIRTFRALTRVQPGFTSSSQVETFSTFIPSVDAPDPLDLVRKQQSIQEGIRAIPGVSSVGFATAIPMGPGHWNDPIRVEDRTVAQGELPSMRRFIFISRA